MKELSSGFIWAGRLLLSRDLGGLDLVASAAGPASQIRQNFTLLAIHTRLHLAPPLLSDDRGFYTGGPGSGSASHLSREAGALDCLGALLNLILITATMHRHHFTCALLHLVSHCRSPMATVATGHRVNAEHHHSNEEGHLQRPL